MVFFLYGEDDFRSRQKLKEIKERFLGSAGDAGLSFFDFAQKPGEDMRGSFGSQGLFSEKRLIISENLIISGNKERQDEVREYLESDPGIFSDQDAIVVFWEGKIPPKNKSLFKLLEKKQEIRKENFEKLTGSKLSGWIRKRIGEINPGQTISGEALQELLFFSGENTWILSGEIEKLAQLASGRNIEKKDVEDIVVSNISGNIFATIDALSRNDKKQALKLLLEHLERGDEPFYLLSMFIYQYRNLLVVADLLQRGIQNEAEIAKVSKLHPYVIKKSIPQSRNMGFSRLKDIYCKLGEIDRSAKTGGIDIKLALPKFVVEL